ncbi:MAG: hypothetical protein ACEQR5_10235, partial [Moraxellaceae bacterium]
MIIHLKSTVSAQQAAQLAQENKAFHIVSEGKNVLITGSGVKEVPAGLHDFTDEHWVFANDMQLASRAYRPTTREVKIGNVTVGGDTKNTIIISGPCSVESEAQIRESAALLKANGLTSLRGGCYKPRTSPYSFQGMGLDGLKLLAKMREEHGFTVVTEARDATHIDEI